ncbi:hypothetical protein KSP39_PZI008859 [Platanthera zijinensis]|uniref:Uncharacterized protein n=1 Tax=Platanthera zijinensis TaxID=2320716 RepID=A0AAP0BL33_9ASPA
MNEDFDKMRLIVGELQLNESGSAIPVPSVPAIPMRSLLAPSSSELKPSKMFKLIKCDGVFSTPEACFSNYGPNHTLVIRLEEEEQQQPNVKMKVLVDDNVVYEVDTKNRFQENMNFKVDKMEVDFTWDLRDSPAYFSFKTWPHDSTGEIEEECHWLATIYSRHKFAVILLSNIEIAALGFMKKIGLSPLLLPEKFFRKNNKKLFLSHCLLFVARIAALDFLKKATLPPLLLPEKFFRKKNKSCFSANAPSSL